MVNRSAMSRAETPEEASFRHDGAVLADSEGADGDALVPYQLQVDDWDSWKQVWDQTSELMREMKRAWWVLHPGTRDTPQIVANVQPKKSGGRAPKSSMQEQTNAPDDGEGIIMPWGDEWAVMQVHNTFLEVWDSLKQRSSDRSRSAPAIGRPCL